MTETHTHCQCDCCSGADCGQDDPDKFAAEQDAIQKAHDEKVRKAERERVLDAVLKIKDNTDFHFTSDRIKFEREIESLRSSD